MITAPRGNPAAQQSYTESVENKMSRLMDPAPPPAAVPAAASAHRDVDTRRKESFFDDGMDLRKKDSFFDDSKISRDFLDEASKPLLDLEKPGDNQMVKSCEDEFQDRMKFFSIFTKCKYFQKIYFWKYYLLTCSSSQLGGWFRVPLLNVLLSLSSQ